MTSAAPATAVTNRQFFQTLIAVPTAIWTDLPPRFLTGLQHTDTYPALLELLYELVEIVEDKISDHRKVDSEYNSDSS